MQRVSFEPVQSYVQCVITRRNLKPGRLPVSHFADLRTVHVNLNCSKHRSPGRCPTDEDPGCLFRTRIGPLLPSIHTTIRDAGVVPALPSRRPGLRKHWAFAATPLVFAQLALSAWSAGDLRLKHGPGATPGRKPLRSPAIAVTLPDGASLASPSSASYRRLRGPMRAVRFRRSPR